METSMNIEAALRSLDNQRMKLQLNSLEEVERWVWLSR
jgi:hypothetical protein